MSSIMDKLKKNSKVKQTEVLSDSKFFNDKEMTPTDVPMVNVALSGSIDGGLAPGLTVLAGPSKHFKTSFALLMAGAYLKAHPKAVMLFYDSEFGSPQSYFEQFGIDTSRVLHTPITNVEELKFDMIGQLEELSREDEVIIVIDSIGNMASKKEMEDTLNEKSVADMSRAKALKGLFRMCTPYLAMKNIPLVAVNHTYKEIGLFPKDIVGGGCMVAGTKIQMTDYTLKNIEDVVVGDIVRTLSGGRPVTATWNPETLVEGTPDCYEVEFEDGAKFSCSDQHMFLRGGEWVEITELSVGDDVSAV